MGIGLTGGDPLDEGGVRLTYQLANGDEVRYSLDGSRHIREVEVRRSGTPIQRLTVSRDDGVFPVEAVYRDLASFRELRITRETVEHVEPFPPDIWLR
jgi:protein involved in polysaccharide export with SLBB domain